MYSPLSPPPLHHHHDYNDIIFILSIIVIIVPLPPFPPSFSFLFFSYLCGVVCNQRIEGMEDWEFSSYVLCR